MSTTTIEDRQKAGAVETPVREVAISPRSVDPFAGILGWERVDEIQRVASGLHRKLDGRIIWNVNSTAAGGGVAEMLNTLLAYARGLGVNTRWLVIGGNPEFFRITKRLHNALHGERGDGSVIDGASAEAYGRVCERNARVLAERIRPGDVAILHDPQTAGLIPHLVGKGAGVIWRCHIGSDVRTGEADRAWAFLEPHLKSAHAFIFSRFSYIPDFLYQGRCLVYPPSIDPFSPKNQEMDERTVRAILVRLGVVSGETDDPRTFRLDNGQAASVERAAEIVREGPAPAWGTPLVVQVSRWDRLKDPVGVLNGFLRGGEATRGAQLVLAGPSVEEVADDPEGAEVFREVLECWRGLPEDRRRRVQLVNLPMDDLQENAAMVNALQRHAAVVVQKSLREGFGLTVTEAMWKGRPVVASAVGGIRDQIQHGVSGLLLKDPGDLDAFAGELGRILSNGAFAARLGRNAKRRVCQNYLGLRIASQYDDLVELLERDLRPAR